MSGTFNDIDVPPTLCSFAVDIAKVQDIITPELKEAGNVLVKFDIEKDQYSLPVYSQLMSMYGQIREMAQAGIIKSAYATGYGGICEAVSKMAFGNGLGVTIDNGISNTALFAKDYGSIIAEVAVDGLAKITVPYTKVAEVTDNAEFVYNGTSIPMEEALEAWTSRLESVFPTRSGVKQTELEDNLYEEKNIYISKNKTPKPEVFIPVFPGTNCEYDTARAFEAAGAAVNTVVFKNMTESQITDSARAFENAVKNAQILMFSGGFSAGDEPDGLYLAYAMVSRHL